MFEWFSARNGDEKEFELWLEAIDEANVRDDFGRTPLHIAAQMGHVAIAKSLLDFKGNVNAIDDHGRTPLCVALTSSKARM